jgi:hypothetical protein
MAGVHDTKMFGNLCSRVSTTDGFSLAIIDRKFKNLDFKFIVNLKTKKIARKIQKEQ